MRIYSKEERLFIRRLLSHTNGFHVGESLVNDLFGMDSLALLLLDDGRACLFAAPDAPESVNAKKQKLFTLMALLEESEQDNMIVCIDEKMQSFLYLSSQDTSLAIDRGRYTFRGGSIEVDQNVFTLKSTSGYPIMTGTVLTSSFARSLHHYFASEEYVTSRLQKLVDHDFKSAEILQYEKEISYARKSLWVSWAAFFVAILSIIFSVPISNKWGYSTMETLQYEGLENAINNVSEEIHKATDKLDSIYVACCETKSDFIVSNKQKGK